MTNEKIINEIEEIISLCNQGFDEEKHKFASERITKLNNLVGTGTVPGRVVRFQVADGYALYFIVKVLKSKVQVAHIPLYDGYQFAGVIQSRDGYLYLPRQVAEKSLRWDDMMNKVQDESESFFNNLRTGTIVHYHNGFNSYVRCQVTNDKQLISMALVGDWRPNDLPHRQTDGSIYYPYHPKAIQESKKWRCHASNVYEFPQFQKKSFTTDPRPLNAIDLTVPPMTTAERELAKQQQNLALLRRIVNENETPEQVFSRVQIFFRDLTK